MNSRKPKIAVAITGASGAIYAKLLLQALERLRENFSEIDVVFSETGRLVWQHEIGSDTNLLPFRQFANNDYFAPIASGSARYSAMVICPCTMGTLGRIASGTADDLICRAADVQLKERRKLILVTRETPLSLIHINNQRMLTEAGAIICPASPSFYSQPQTIDELCNTVVERVLSLIGIDGNFFEWGK